MQSKKSWVSDIIKEKINGDNKYNGNNKKRKETAMKKEK
jgi:hypothetical protein